MYCLLFIGHNVIWASGKNLFSWIFVFRGKIYIIIHQYRYDYPGCLGEAFKKCNICYTWVQDQQHVKNMLEIHLKQKA